MKKSKIALAILAFSLPATASLAAEKTSDHGNKTSHQADATIHVTTTIQPDNVTTETLSAEQLERIGANDFGNIMRYQPLISAPFSASGSSNGKSSFDRGGYSGYNIRGLDGNRISLDVNGIPLPDATGRSYDPTAGENTFGIGRDYIDPYLYGRVNIASGSTQKDTVNNVVGGSVSFVSKSPEDYLFGGKTNYFSYTSHFDTVNHSWHNGITSAFGNDTAKLLLAYSRRDGQQTRNNSDYLSSYPMRWNTNAFLINGVYLPNEENRISGSVDFYHKSSGAHSPYWEGNHSPGSDSIIGASYQKNISQRYTILLQHEFSPENNSMIDKLNNKVFYQQTHVSDHTHDSIFDAIYDKKKNNPRFAAFNPKDTWTFSDLNTHTYGLSSEISKQYGINAVNYGINFASTKTRRPFRQIKQPAIWTFLQPQGDSDSYDINLWLGDTITVGAFSVLPQLKYSWHRINPKGFGPADTNALGSFTGEDLAGVYSKTFTDNQLLPSLTLMYSFNETLNTYFQYKRGVSYPTTSQMYGIWLHPKIGRSSPASIGNPDLKTESSHQFELGIVGHASEGLVLRGSLFYNSYDNFIANKKYYIRDRTGKVIGFPELAKRIPEGVSTLYYAENRDKAYIYGAELSGTINYGSWMSAVNGLSSTFAIGYNGGKSKSSFTGDSWVDIDSVLPLKGIITLAYDDPQNRFGASLSATFVNGKQAQDPYRQNYNNKDVSIAAEAAAKRNEYMRIPGFGTLDFSAYYQITQHVRVNAGIYNITDTKYWDYASNKNLHAINAKVTDEHLRDIALGTAAGRTYQIGVTANF